MFSQILHLKKNRFFRWLFHMSGFTGFTLHNSEWSCSIYYNVLCDLGLVINTMNNCKPQATILICIFMRLITSQRIWPGQSVCKLLKQYSSKAHGCQVYATKPAQALRYLWTPVAKQPAVVLYHIVSHWHHWPGDNTLTNCLIDREFQINPELVCKSHKRVDLNSKSDSAGMPTRISSFYRKVQIPVSFCLLIVKL